MYFSVKGTCEKRWRKHKKKRKKWTLFKQVLGDVALIKAVFLTEC